MYSLKYPNKNNKIFLLGVVYMNITEAVKKRFEELCYKNGDKGTGDKGTVLLSPFFVDIIHLLCYSKLG